MKEAANMTLWCKRGDRVIKFTTRIGIPKQIDDELWECEWSLGELLVHEGVPLKNINSMFTLLGAIRFIGVFLQGRSKQGDLFFFDESLSEPIEDMEELFGLVLAEDK